MNLCSFYLIGGYFFPQSSALQPRLATNLHSLGLSLPVLNYRHAHDPQLETVEWRIKMHRGLQFVFLMFTVVLGIKLRVL